MNLKDKNLEEAINYKIGNFQFAPLTQEDLDRVHDLGLNNKTFSGKNKNINLGELRLLTNLKSLCLQYFELNDEVVQIINDLSGLKILQLVSCNYTSEIDLQGTSLDSLVINNCKIREYGTIVAPQSFTVISQENFVLSKIKGKENIKKMGLQNCGKIIGFNSIFECVGLEQLNMDGSTADDKKALEHIKKKIPVSQQERSLPIR